jgi:hypothetical protein
VVRRKNPVVVDWAAYFWDIRSECPWSWAAWQQAQIDIQSWTGSVRDLGPYQARMYLVRISTQELEALTDQLCLQYPNCEWLYSYPEYGESATPVPVLIQQDRDRLQRLRQQLGPDWNQ